MRIVLLGAPGSGKGTQGKKLEEHYHTPQISTGDALRAAVADGSPLGKMAKAAMDAGQLVSDDIVLGIIRNRLNQKDTHKGFILDGFPRNQSQAEALDEVLEEMGQPLELAILIDVDFDLLLQRMVGRHTCRSCGWTCNIFTAPPHVDGVCDECGGNLHHRADDNEETISNRLRIFETTTMPLVEYYRDKGILRTVQGVGEINDVFAALKKVVDQAAANRKAVKRKPLASNTKSAAAAIAAQRAQQQDAETSAKSKPKSVKKAKAKPTTDKKAAASKTTTKVTSKKAEAKKPATDKKLAAKKKKAAATKSAKKKVVKKATVKKKAGAKVAKKKVVKKAVAKKKVAKKKIVAKKKAVAKKTAKKKIVKKPAVKKKAAKKKVVARKKATKKKVAKKKKTKRR